MGLRFQGGPRRSGREHGSGGLKKSREVRSRGLAFRAFPLPPVEKLSPRLSDADLFRDDPRGTLRAFVGREAQGNGFREKLVNLARAIAEIPSEEKGLSALADSWANRSAADIIRSKRLFVVPTADKRLATVYSIQGCMDAATALVATGRLLAKNEGVNARFLLAREKRHVLVRITFEGVDMLVDAQYQHAIPLNAELRLRYAEESRGGEYAEGEGPRAIGVHSLHDFFAHDKRKFDQLKKE